ncbi:hypothetical protein L839_1975 [Mycobacterium avium MAV_120809_2495]|nr:hypothetical protein L839_1975 [Mycobacterium avium MAV_120809_2495]
MHTGLTLAPGAACQGRNRVTRICKYPRHVPCRPPHPRAP